jgi:hypothetical protein
MQLSMHEASVPVFCRSLHNLSAVLDKAERQAAERRIEPAVLLNQRLAPDMYPLDPQVQAATNFAKGAAARLVGIEAPHFESVEKSFEELRQRISRTAEFMQGIDAAKIEGSEEREITTSQSGEAMTFDGRTYLLHFALPNFFFHVTVAYAILRHNGIVIGKADFIGPFL